LDLRVWENSKIDFNCIDTPRKVGARQKQKASSWQDKSKTRREGNEKPAAPPKCLARNSLNVDFLGILGLVDLFGDRQGAARILVDGGVLAPQESGMTFDVDEGTQHGRSKNSGSHDDKRRLILWRQLSEGQSEAHCTDVASSANNARH